MIEKLQSNWNKPDNPFWKKVGNFCVIVLTPVGTVAIEVLLPDPYKQIAAVAWASVMAVIKAGTKLTTNNQKT